MAWPQLNNGMLYLDKVSGAEEGQELLEFYSRRYPHSASEVGWRIRIARGQVLVGNEACRDPHRILWRGATLEYKRLPWQEPEVPYSLPVLYEDDHLLAVSKPPGLQVLPGGPFNQRTALTLLKWWYTNGGLIPAPVHRLGRGTSGVLLCAKTPGARTALAADFAEATTNRSEIEPDASRCSENVRGPVRGPCDPPLLPCKRIAKTYRALVRGVIQENILDVTQPIGRIKHSGVRGGLHAATPDGKPSRSRIRVVSRDLKTCSTIVEVDLFTGRPHQIRVHCAAAGFPLVGDPLYIEGGVPADLDGQTQHRAGEEASMKERSGGEHLREAEHQVETLSEDTLSGAGGRVSLDSSKQGVNLDTRNPLRSRLKRDGFQAPGSSTHVNLMGPVDKGKELGVVVIASGGHTDEVMEEDGGHSKGTTPLPGDCGYHLHALRLAFNHPVTKERLVIVAPPPVELCAPNERPEALLCCSIDDIVCCPEVHP